MMKSLRSLGFGLLAAAALTVTSAAQATFVGDPLFGNGLAGWTIGSETNFSGSNTGVDPGNVTFASSVLGMSSLSGTNMAILSTAGSNTLTGTELFQDFGALGTSQAVQVNVKFLTQNLANPGFASITIGTAGGALDPIGVALDTLSPSGIAGVSASAWVSFVVPQGAQSLDFWVFANPPKGAADYLLIDTMAVAVPEPSTYALMLAGLGLLAWAARRRQVNV